MAWSAVWTNNLNALTQAQKEGNVDIIYAYFNNLGWEINPIAAMLGNMELEGQMNPAQWQNGLPIEGSQSGFGLSQWTPYTKLSNYLGTGWQTNYYGQLDRIRWEAEPANQGQQWVPVSGYSYYTFQQFAHDTTHSLQWLVECYEYSYERGTPMISTRLQYAQTWLAYMQQHPPGPGPTPLPRIKIPVWMMCKPIYRK